MSNSKLSKKAGIISQVRMTSTRLPGKVMMTVKGVPLLKYHADRLRQSNLPVIIATTTNSQDDVIAEFALKEKLGCYRGSENDVLARYFEAARQYKLDVVVRVTSDCPLIDGELIGQVARKYLEMNDENVYLSNCVLRTFPRGFDFEIFSLKLLEEAFQCATLQGEREHVTPYIKANYSGKVRIENVLYPHDTSRFRITVDTPEDFELIETLITRYEAHRLNHAEIISILEAHPELAEINAHIEHKKS